MPDTLVRCGGAIRGAVYNRPDPCRNDLRFIALPAASPILGEGIRIVSVTRVERYAAQDASLSCDLLTQCCYFLHIFLSFLKCQ
jgi:hypothetical protein